MRLAPLIVFLLLLGLAPTTSAQDATPEPRPGEGTIRGRLVHQGSARGEPNADVVLYALTAAGEAGLLRTTSDAEGRFEFAGIANDDTAYLIGARVSEIPFGSTIRFEPGETLREVEIEVFEAIRDTAAIATGPVQIRLAQGCTHLRVWHTHELRNDAKSVIHIPESERASSAPIATITLPPGAVGFEMPMGAQGLEKVGGQVRFWGPLYPGTQELEFGYGIDNTDSASALPVAMSRGAPRVRIVLPAGHAEPSADGLRSVGPVDLDGLVHDAYERPALGSDERMTLRLPAPAPLPPGELRLPRSRLLLELDDVALSVNEVHSIQAAEAKPASGPPLLCLPTPPNATDLRFSAASRSMGLAQDPSGVLAIHGPVPAGESSLVFSYQIDSSKDPLLFERTFGSEIELLELVLADTGVIATTTRLHRRRPVRDGDRNYLALEGFGIAPDETVSVALQLRKPGGGMSGALAAGVVAIAGIAALAFLLAPLRDDDEDDQSADSGPSMERQAIYKAIDDLDEDLATGKLSTEDHARMREELRARAVALLRNERDGPRTPSPPPPTVAYCSRCGAKVQTGDRFCSQCGKALPTGTNPGKQESAA